MVQGVVGDRRTSRSRLLQLGGAVAILAGCQRATIAAPVQPAAATVEQTTACRSFLAWLRKAPISEWGDPGTTPDYAANFSDVAWIEEGRRRPHVVDELIEHLEREDLEHPSQDRGRLAVALRALGDKRPRVVRALVRALGTRDLLLRLEATAALTAQGDATALPALETILRDTNEDANVRVNACAAIDAIGPSTPGSVGALQATLADPDQTLVRCARKALDRAR